MNLQLQPRMDLVPWHPCPFYAPSDPHGPLSRLHSKHSLVVGQSSSVAINSQVKRPSEHPNTQPEGPHNQLKPIQLP
jgi:hypothetical protein